MHNYCTPVSNFKKIDGSFCHLAKKAAAVTTVPETTTIGFIMVRWQHEEIQDYSSGLVCIINMGSLAHTVLSKSTPGRHFISGDRLLQGVVVLQILSFLNVNGCRVLINCILSN